MQIPIFKVPVIHEPCVLDWKGTNVACKVEGCEDPKQPRTAALGIIEGHPQLTQNEAKWLGYFLIHVPPDTPWGDVQARSTHKGKHPTTDRHATTLPTERWSWTAASDRRSEGARPELGTL